MIHIHGLGITTIIGLLEEKNSSLMRIHEYRPRSEDISSQNFRLLSFVLFNFFVASCTYNMNADCVNIMRI